MGYGSISDERRACVLVMWRARTDRLNRIAADMNGVWPSGIRHRHSDVDVVTARHLSRDSVARLAGGCGQCKYMMAEKDHLYTRRTLREARMRSATL